MCVWVDVCSASQMRLWHLPCQCTPAGCNPVSHVSACWLTGLGLGTPSRYLARTISGTPVNYYYYYHVEMLLLQGGRVA